MASLPAGLLAFFAALRRLGPAHSTMLGSVEPLVSILFAAATFGERLGPLQWAGVGLVVGVRALFEAADRGVQNRRVSPCGIGITARSYPR